MRESASPLEEIGPPGPPGHDSDGIHASAAEFHGGPFEMAPSRRRTPRSDPRSGRSRERPVRRLLAHWPHLRWLVRPLDSPGRRAVRASLQAALRRPLLGRGRQPPRPALHLLPDVERSRRLRVDPSPCRLGRRNPASAGQCRQGMWLRVQSPHPRGGACSGDLGVGSSRPLQSAPCRGRCSRRRTSGSKAQDCVSAWRSVLFWGCRCSTTPDSAWPLARHPAWLSTPSLVVGVTSQKPEIRTRRNGDEGPRRPHESGELTPTDSSPASWTPSSPRRGCGSR